MGIDGQSSAEPMRGVRHEGFSDGINIFRPCAVELMRRCAKLRYDEGLMGKDGFQWIFLYATAGLANLHRGLARKGGRVRTQSEISEIMRMMTLMQTSAALSSKLEPKDSQQTKQQEDILIEYRKMFNIMNVVGVYPESTAVEYQIMLVRVMRIEPDPFVGASSRLEDYLTLNDF